LVIASTLIVNFTTTTFPNTFELLIDTNAFRVWEMVITLIVLPVSAFRRIKDFIALTFLQIFVILYVICSVVVCSIMRVKTVDSVYTEMDFYIRLQNIKL